MEDRPVVVRDGGSNSVAIFGIIAVLVIVGIALFVWQPWNSSSSKNPTTIINNPVKDGGGGAGSGGGSGGTSGSGTSGSSGQ